MYISRSNVVSQAEDNYYFSKDLTSPAKGDSRNHSSRVQQDETDFFGD
jgi:hypothetical protein